MPCTNVKKWLSDCLPLRMFFWPIKNLFITQILLSGRCSNNELINSQLQEGFYLPLPSALNTCNLIKQFVWMTGSVAYSTYRGAATPTPWPCLNPSTLWLWPSPQWGMGIFPPITGSDNYSCWPWSAWLLLSFQGRLVVNWVQFPQGKFGKF